MPEQMTLNFTTFKKYCKFFYTRENNATFQFKNGCGHPSLKRKRFVEKPKELNAHFRCTEMNCPVLKRVNRAIF
jgi:hypothetical protein